MQQPPIPHHTCTHLPGLCLLAAVKEQVGATAVLGRQRLHQQRRGADAGQLQEELAALGQRGAHLQGGMCGDRRQGCG